MVSSGQVTGHYPMVQTKLQNGNKLANMNILLEISNQDKNLDANVTIKCNIYFSKDGKFSPTPSISIQENVFLKKDVHYFPVWFTNNTHSQLNLENPGQLFLFFIYFLFYFILLKLFFIFYFYFIFLIF